MELKVKKQVFKENIETIEVTFPYFGWWDSDKDEIIRIDIEYYTYNASVSHLKYVKICNNWGSTPSIIAGIVRAERNIVGEDLTILLRDYADIATEEEFEKFKEDALNKIFNK